MNGSKPAATTARTGTPSIDAEIGYPESAARKAAESVPRKATTDDAEELSRTLAAAFLDDPVFAWGYPDSGRRRTILPAVFRIVARAYLPYEQTYTTDHVVAGAIWAPPGAEGDDDDLAEALGEASGEYAPRVFQVFELLAEQHPDTEHHYLFFLGTRPGWQSRGIGSALMRPVLDSCDRNGVPAYLEATSERNRSLYLRHGFKVISEIHLPNGPCLWPMWREVR